MNPHAPLAQTFLADREKYRDHLARFLEAANLHTDTAVKALTRKQCLEAIEAMRKHPYANATIRVAMTTVREFYRWLVDFEHIPTNPVADVRFKGKSNVPMENVIPLGQIDAFWRIVKQEATARDKAILLAILTHGFRASELCRLTWGMVKKEEDGYVLLFTAKGGKQRRIKLSKDVVRVALHARPVSRPPEDDEPFVISHGVDVPLNRLDVYRIVTHWTRKAGMNVTPHGLRATAISKAIKEKGIEYARQFAGHEFITTTQRYSRWDLLE